MGRRKWKIKKHDKELAAELSESCGLDALTALLLVTRGITTAEEAQAFLSREAELIDPFELRDMDRAVERITQAVDSGEQIVVYGDYDADGVTASTVLYSYLSMIGAQVSVYIPEREAEGFGLHREAIDAIAAQGATLIVTVDNGIAAVEEAAYAGSVGVDLVVTDHHLPGDTLPRAYAVVDPMRQDNLCAYRGWCGVGVAFKLICALEGSDGADLLDEYADIVTIGTIADVMELRGENRMIVRRGLEQINAGVRRPGVQALLECAGMGDKEIGATDIAFAIAPRINAAGRMGSAKKAFELLMCDDPDQARELAASVNHDNAVRSEIQRKMVLQAREQLAGRAAFDRVLVVAAEGWHQGIIGIVAAKLAEEYGKPCFAVSIDGQSAKGSARSAGVLSIYDALCACSDVLDQYGGHAGAGGFSLRADRIGELRERLNAYAAGHGAGEPVMEIDCCLRPAFLQLPIVDAVKVLEPFGTGNPQPVFGMLKVQIDRIVPLGKNRNHQRITFSRDGAVFTAMFFHREADSFEFRQGDLADVAFTLDKSTYNGVERLELHIKDMRHCDEQQDDTRRGIDLYEKYMRGEKLTREDATYAPASREAAVLIFAFLKKAGAWHCGAAELSYRICCARQYRGITSGTVLMALEAMAESGVVVESGGCISLSDKKEKSDLFRSPVFQAIGAAGKDGDTDET
ncbi:MAG TPA: single-stranded-DNA-specific exonuclease RecJ [Candidatus Onthovicinus excrementipullorum]|nr:single-stranded-DNA-specific exonuclease RecJ [Candidatus Onthovicinus excrementipullorum]